MVIQAAKRKGTAGTMCSETPEVALSFWLCLVMVAVGSLYLPHAEGPGDTISFPLGL